MKIPAGIRFLGLLNLSLASLMLGLWVVALRHPQEVINEVRVFPWIPVLHPADLIVLPMSGTISLLLGLGLLFLQNRARGLLLFLSAIPLVVWPVSLLLGLVFGRPLAIFFTPRTAINLGWNGWICWYLNRDDVKRAFAVPEPHYEDLEMIAEESLSSSRAGRPNP